MGEERQWRTTHAVALRPMEVVGGEGGLAWEEQRCGGGRGPLCGGTWVCGEALGKRSPQRLTASHCRRASRSETIPSLGQQTRSAQRAHPTVLRPTTLKTPHPGRGHPLW